MSKPTICVTGATGYLASRVVYDLLQSNKYNVRGTVRSLAKKEIVDPLQSFSKDLKLFEADLVKPDSFAEAFKGCNFIIHCASPFFRIKEGDEDVFTKPAVEGTISVLETALKAGVTRVAITSSMGSAMNDKRLKDPKHVWTEADWNDGTKQYGDSAYRAAKAAAEKAAHAFGKEHPEMRVVTILPGFVLGPPLLKREGTSVQSIKGLVLGVMKNGVPGSAVTTIDVRDCSLAHIKAIESDKASGRYVCCNTAESSLLQLANYIEAAYPKKYALPTKELQASNALEIGSDNTRTLKDLDIKFRPIEETMKDMVKGMIDVGVLPK